MKILRTFFYSFALASGAAGTLTAASAQTLEKFSAAIPQLGIQTDKALSYVMELQTPSSSCTATLLRLKELENRCVLVSSAHCLNAGVSDENLTLTFRSYPFYRRPWMKESDWLADWRDETFYLSTSLGGVLTLESETFALPPQLPTRVLKKNLTWDVVELEVPEQIKTSVCPHLIGLGQPSMQPTTSSSDGKKGAYLGIYGLVNGFPQARYPMDLPWRGVWANSLFRYHAVGPEKRDQMIELADMRMSPGMSGGPAFTRGGEFWGINSRFIPFVHQTYITPYASLIAFLRSKLKSAGSSRLDHWSGAYLLSNQFLPGGGNSIAGGGGNSIAGGDAERAPLKDRRFVAQNPLSLVQEPAEGVIDPANSSRRILAINGYAVDGWDDYFRLRAYFGEKAPVIARPANGYPEVAIRKALFKRLASKGMIAPAFSEQRGKRMAYLPDPFLPEGWKLSLAGPQFLANTHIEVKRREKAEITFTAFDGFMSVRNGSPLAGNIRPGDGGEYVYTASFENDYKTVRLRATHLPAGNGIPEYICDNRHYSKLVCAAFSGNSPTGILSLQVNGLYANDAMTIKTRIASLVSGNDGGPPVLIFDYSILARLGGWSER